AMAEARELPIFAVGPGTAATARGIGLPYVIAGDAGVDDLAVLISERIEVNAGPLVYLSGDVVAGDLAGDLRRLRFHVLPPLVYSTHAPTASTPPTAARFEEGGLAGVSLLPPRPPRPYARLLRQYGVAARASIIQHFCLSEAIARQLATLGSVPVTIASSP